MIVILTEAARAAWTTLIADLSARMAYDKTIGECHRDGALEIALVRAVETAIAVYEQERKAAINPTWPTP